MHGPAVIAPVAPASAQQSGLAWRYTLGPDRRQLPMRCCARMRRVGQGSSECWPTSGTLGASRQRRGLRPAAPGAGAAAAAAADRPARLDHRPAQGPEPRHARGGAGGAGRPRIPGRRRRPGQPGQAQPALQRVLRRSLELPAHHGARPLRPPCRPRRARCCGAPHRRERCESVLVTSPWPGMCWGILALQCSTHQAWRRGARVRIARGRLSGEGAPRLTPPPCARVCRRMSCTRAATSPSAASRARARCCPTSMSARGAGGGRRAPGRPPLPRGRASRSDL